MTKLNISSVVSSPMSHESSGPFWNILAIESDVVMQPYGAVDNKAEQSTTPMRTRQPHAYQYCCIPQRFSSSKRNEVAFHEFPSMGEREKKECKPRFDETKDHSSIQGKESIAKNTVSLWIRRAAGTVSAQPNLAFDLVTHRALFRYE